MDDDLPDRRTVEQALRSAGLSRRLAKRFISAGWPALVDEHRALVDELRSQLTEMKELLHNSSSPPAA